MKPPKRMPKRDRKASALAKQARADRKRSKFFAEELRSMNEVNKKYNEIKQEIAKHEDGVFGVDTKLVAALMCTLFGNPIVDRVGTMLLAEHLAERLPAFIEAKKGKGKDETAERPEAIPGHPAGPHRSDHDGLTDDTRTAAVVRKGRNRGEKAVRRKG
jgi:hypothetical protein